MSPTLQRPPVIPPTEYAERRKRVVDALEPAGLRALIAWSRGGSTLDAFGDVFYLTNHYSVEPISVNRPPVTGFGHNAVILSAETEPVLLVNLGAREDLVHVERIISDQDLYGAVLDTLGELGLRSGRIGISRYQDFPLPLHEEIKARYPDIEFVPADDLLDAVQLRKSPAEVALLRHASEVGAEVMNSMLSAVESGRTDADIASIGFTTASRLGATPYDFPNASGPNAGSVFWGRLPSFDPWRPYEDGDILHPDVYGCVDGYFYDIQRSMVVGRKPTGAQREALEMAVAAVDHVCAQLTPGKPASEAYLAGAAWIEEEGPRRSAAAGAEFSVLPFPIFGHGIGVKFEGPWISANDHTILEPGMVVAVELFVSMGGTQLAIHEQVVEVTDGLPALLTGACPARWWD